MLKNQMLRILFCLSSIVLTATAAHSEQVNVSRTKSDAQVVVVTTFYPLFFLTKQIVKDDVQVLNLSAGVEIHDYVLSPQDRVKLENADMVIYYKQSLETWLKNVLPQLPNQNFQIGLSNELEKTHSSTLNEHDPHVWLDPVLVTGMITIIEMAVKQLKVSDPVKKSFVKRAMKLRVNFSRLARNYQKQLKTCKKSAVIVSHRVLDYVAERHGFRAYSVAGLSTHDNPSLKTLVGLKKLAQRKNIRYVLLEENQNQDFVQLLSREANLKILPFSSLEQESEDQDFLGVMYENLTSLKVALDCR